MTKMMLTRKGFLGAAAGGTLLLLLQACGGGGDDGASGKDTGGAAGGTGGSAAPSEQSCGANGSAIASNHGHSVTIPVADLDSTSDKTYSIQGAASHDHQITLTVAQLQALKAGKEVTVTSTTTFSHEHGVTTSCA